MGLNEWDWRLDCQALAGNRHWFGSSLFLLGRNWRSGGSLGCEKKAKRNYVLVYSSWLLSPKACVTDSGDDRCLSDLLS